MNSFGAARVAPEEAVFRPALPMSIRPGLNGTDMGKMSYAEQLKHPNWQRKRLEMLDAAGWTCDRCDAADVTLHVHHKSYFKGRMAWEYSGEELQVLCEDCHSLEHKKRELLDRLLIPGDDGYDRIELAIGLLAGFLDMQLALQGEFADDCRKFSREFVFGEMAGLLGEQSWPQVAKLIEQIPPFAMNPAQAQFAAWMVSMRED